MISEESSLKGASIAVIPVLLFLKPYPTLMWERVRWYLLLILEAL